MAKRIIVATILLVAGFAAASPAMAADNIMKVCGAKYQAAKTNKSLPAGQTWNQFLAQCRSSSAPAPAPAAAPAAARPAPVVKAAPVVKTAAASPRPQSAGMAAAHDRQRQCGAQWKADKAAGKIPAGQTWPKYWSACNTRLKGS